MNGGLKEMDRQIICSSCGTIFVWTASEQEFYRVKDLSEPQRCRSCREERRRRYEIELAAGTKDANKKFYRRM